LPTTLYRLGKECSSKNPVSWSTFPPDKPRMYWCRRNLRYIDTMCCLPPIGNWQRKLRMKTNQKNCCRYWQGKTCMPMNPSWMNTSQRHRQYNPSCPCRKQKNQQDKKCMPSCLFRKHTGQQGKLCRKTIHRGC
jgi:hypothetical protein